MKKNGFTLVEILAVLVLIAAIGIIAIPSIINYINNSKNEISGVTKQLIFTGAELYMGQNNLDETQATKYCISLNQIVNAGLLDAPIIDSVNNEEISLDKFVDVTLEYDDDLQKYKFNYDLTDECKSIDIICKGVTEPTTGNIPQGNYNPGDEYICQVNETTSHHFFVLSSDPNRVNLIMDSNVTNQGQEIKTTDVIETCKTTEGCEFRTTWMTTASTSEDEAEQERANIGRAKKGPLTALNFLNEATEDWHYIPPLNETHMDEGGNYGQLKLIGRARMATKAEINELFLDKQYNMDNFKTSALPIWATNYLYNDLDAAGIYMDGVGACNGLSDRIPNIEGRTHVGYLGIYWLLDSAPEAPYDMAYEVGFDAGMDGKSRVWPEQTIEKWGLGCWLKGGVRPVISINKNQIQS